MDKILRFLKNDLVVSALVIVIFLFYFLAVMGITDFPEKGSYNDASFLLFNLECIVPFCLISFCLYGRRVIAATGLYKSPLTGLIYALMSVLPMLLFVIFWGKWNKELSFWYIVNTTLVAGFFEELFFRGILLGMLFRYARWGFVPAVLISSLIFALGHIYQGGDLFTSLLAALVTGFGGLLFGWIYIESNYNLWFSIFLHALMNFSWIAFSLAENAASAGVGLNIARLLTVIIAVVLVVVYKKRKGLPYVINKRTLWRNRMEEIPPM